MEAKQPTQSFEFVCEWFERAATNAKANGKHDSAALWQDGLDHLTNIASQRDDLVKALQEARTKLDTLHYQHSGREAADIYHVIGTCDAALTKAGA